MNYRKRGCGIVAPVDLSGLAGDGVMMRILPPGNLPWIAGRFREVPHGLGASVAICRIDIPADVPVSPQLVGHGELERAARIRDPAERSFLLASHAVLRSVLADALGKSAMQLELYRDEFGKPRLADGSLHFNMSRSRSATLIGLSVGAEIGVDIEMIREFPDAAVVARECLSSQEYAQWRRLDAVSAMPALLQCWARKEACLKAAGIGLAGAPERLDAGWRRDDLPERLNLRHGARHWDTVVVSLPVPPELVAAAAVVVA